jgi:nitroimidazol reductase NimA-like FMN-containing flavoprotein (pyridoxamine 5'-phosphate oxidase superfamily)
MKHELQAKCVDILSRCADMTIATVRPDGAPHATVVSFVHDGLLVYFGCGVGSQKAANIAADPRVSVTITEPYKDWQSIRGISMGGTAAEVTDSRELARVGKLMVDRFPELASALPAERGLVKVFRVTPAVVSVLDYTMGFGHTDSATVEAGDIAELADSRRHRWLALAAG